VPPATDDVIAALDALRGEVECCSSCVLAETRTKAVFGEGDPGADLMFVGEAPGYHEDQQGRPFVGQAGKLLEQLLASIGMTREQVYIANVLKSRPPNNRDPRPEEIDACRPYLWRQIEIIRPKVICTLGNFATKLLSGDQRGITKVHGQPRATEIAGHRLYLYPIFHPAAALYTPANLATLKEDFLRLPELLAHAAPQPGEEAPPSPAAQRPAWRPPERLRPQAAAPAPTPADEAPAAALVFDDDPTPPAEPAAPATSAESAPPATPAPEVPAASAAPAPADPVVGSAPTPDLTPVASASPVAASIADDPAPDDPAPASPPAPEARPPAPEAGPPAEPEQLGLF
jgi:uracil-DNA glycosylase